MYPWTKNARFECDPTMVFCPKKPRIKKFVEATESEDFWWSKQAIKI